MKRKAIQALLELGIPAGNKGFRYILDAIELINGDSCWLDKMCALYAKIAERQGTNAFKVERAIRYSFKEVTEYGNLAMVEKWLSAEMKPTNGNMLATLYFRLKGDEDGI